MDVFYKKYWEMRKHFFAEPSAATQAAQNMYLSIVGHPGIVQLTLKLNLALTDGGQDWAIEVSDASRVSEFLDYYETATLYDDERYCLVDLILASLDDYLSMYGQDKELTKPITNRVKHLLSDSFEAYCNLVAYWACLQAPDTLRFAITPLMQDLWALHHKRCR